MTDNDPAQNELDACLQTIKFMSAEITELRQLLANTTATLESAVATIETLNKLQPLLPKVLPTKRSRGRPRKVYDDSWMLEWFDKSKVEFLAAKKFKKATDDNVITWAFEQLFLSYGQSASKANSTEFQTKLKRFKNRLGDIRNPIVKTPI